MQQAHYQSVAGCHGLAPWSVTMLATHWRELSSDATGLSHWYLHKSDSWIPPMAIGGLFKSNLQTARCDSWIPPTAVGGLFKSNLLGLPKWSVSAKLKAGL